MQKYPFSRNIFVFIPKTGAIRSKMKIYLGILQVIFAGAAKKSIFAPLTVLTFIHLKKSTHECFG